MKWWNTAILNQPRSDSASFKAVFGDRKGLAKNTEGETPILHISLSSFLPEVGSNY